MPTETGKMNAETKDKWDYYFATWADSWFLWPAVEVGNRVTEGENVMYVELRFLYFSWNWERKIQ